jgi:hypothetical protein
VAVTAELAPITHDFSVGFFASEDSYQENGPVGVEAICCRLKGSDLIEDWSEQHVSSP